MRPLQVKWRSRTQHRSSECCSWRVIAASELLQCTRNPQRRFGVVWDVIPTTVVVVVGMSVVDIDIELYTHEIRVSVPTFAILCSHSGMQWC